MRKLLFLGLIGLPLLLSSACPVTHVYFSKKFFKVLGNYSLEEEKTFLVGTLFPDIGYLGHGERGHTHFEACTIQEVLEEKDPFMAGVKFHSWLDCRREELVEQDKIYDLLNEPAPGKFALLKFIEDELYFSSSLWAETISATLFASISCCFPTKLHFDVEEELMKEWNKILFFYFLSGPSRSLYLLHLSGKKALGLTREEIALWSHEIKQWSQKEIWLHWSEKLDNHIENLLYFERKKQESRLSI